MSGEEPSPSIRIFPTLYLGKETTVNGNTWDFGQSNVLCKTAPTEPEMVANKAYVDSAIEERYSANKTYVENAIEEQYSALEEQKQRIDAILGDMPADLDSFKEMAQMVNNIANNEEASLLSIASDLNTTVRQEMIRAESAEQSIIDETNRMIEELRGELTRSYERETEMKVRLDALYQYFFRTNDEIPN